MAIWILIAVVGWAGFQLGKWIAMWFWPRVEGARSNPVSSSRITVALIILAAAIGFFTWNQSSRAYPFTMLHAGILAGCVALGYHSARGRQASLQGGINSLAQGVSKAFAYRAARTLRELMGTPSSQAASPANDASGISTLTW
jgi:hypothetical protein